MTTYQAIERLMDGREAFIRELGPADRENLLTVWAHLSPISRYYRFLSPKKNLTDSDLDYFTNVDFKSHVALIVFVDENGEMSPVATGRYIVNDGSQGKDAEIAFVVDDPYQGMGIGSLLLAHLTSLARQRGIESFSAYVLTENWRMLEVFEHSGLPMSRATEDPGLLKINLSLKEAVS